MISYLPLQKVGMEYIDLITYLVSLEKIDDLINQFHVSEKSEALIICLKNSLDLHSEVAIFEIEETGGYLEFDKNGNKYIELFPLEHAIDLIEFDLELKDRGYSIEYIAKRLLDYRLNDA